MGRSAKGRDLNPPLPNPPPTPTGTRPPTARSLHALAVDRSADAAARVHALQALAALQAAELRDALRAALEDAEAEVRSFRGPIVQRASNLPACEDDALPSVDPVAPLQDRPEEAAVA